MSRPQSSTHAERPIPQRAVQTPLEESNARHQTLPDFEYIRTQISVVTIAGDLGLEITSRYKARCWRTEHHRNGDADPSIRFLKSKNRWRCFVCDLHSLSNLDLVMMVKGKGTTAQEAARWIADRHYVPPVPKGKHLGPPREQWTPRFRVGVSGLPVLETLVRSGFWAELDDMERRIIPVLLTFADPETGLTKISYQGLMRYAKIGSKKSITKWTKSLERRHLLKITRGRDEGLRPCNVYQVSVDDPVFQESMSVMYRQQRAEVEFERATRVAEKRARRAARSNLPVPV